MTRADSCQQCGRGICVGCTFVRLTRTGKRVHSTAEYNRGWRAANMAAGNCRDCKLPRLPNRVRCEKCLKLHAGWEAERRARRTSFRAATEPAGSTSLGEESRVEAKDQ